MEFCKTCKALKPTEEYPPDNRPRSHGVVVDRYFHWETDSIRIAAKRRIEGRNYARGFVLSAERREDLSGLTRLEEQIAHPAVIAEIERLTHLAVESVTEAECERGNMDTIPLEMPPE